MKKSTKIALAAVAAGFAAWFGLSYWLHASNWVTVLVSLFVSAKCFEVWMRLGAETAVMDSPTLTPITPPTVPRRTADDVGGYARDRRGDV